MDVGRCDDPSPTLRRRLAGRNPQDLQLAALRRLASAAVCGRSGLPPTIGRGAAGVCCHSQRSFAAESLVGLTVLPPILSVYGH